MASVFVTGGTGFIGSRLTEQLVTEGHEVTCLVRAQSQVDRLRQWGVRLATGDVRDAGIVRAAVQRCDAVYHLAGLTTAFHSDELMQVNGEAFRNVVSAAADCPNPPTVVYVSSLAAAGPSSLERPRVESDPAAPVSNYGRAKRAAEVIAEQFADRVPITIVRPPIVFGEGDTHLQTVFRSIYRWGIHFALGVARSRYSLVHVRDLVEALIVCARQGTRLSSGQGSSRGYYFVADEEQPTFAELGLMIGNSLGRQRTRVFRTSRTFALWTGAAMAEGLARLRGRPYIFNFDKVREAQAGHWTCSNQTIRRELGFAPRASMADRLRQTADWYRQQNLL